MSEPAEGESPASQIVVGLTAVVLAVTREEPRILTVRSNGTADRENHDALPFGPLDPLRDRTLELGLRGWARKLLHRQKHHEKAGGGII